MEVPKKKLVLLSDSEEVGPEFSCEILPQDQLKIAVEMTGMGLWRYDVDRKVFCLDQQTCKIHGVQVATHSKWELDSYLKQIHVDDQERFLRALQADSTGGFENAEYRWKRADGSMIWLSASGGGLRREKNTRVIAGGVFDVSARKSLDEQLMTAQKMETVGHLTAGIAHNFNNILTAILPNLHLASRFVEPAGEKFIRNARMAAERASELVSELMVVAGHRDGETKVALDLYSVAERIVRICRTTFGGWIHLAFDMEEDIPFVLGNEGQLEQVLLNLLINARDSLTDNESSCPRIAVELESGVDALGAPCVSLRVEDNGEGMTPETMERIYEPFFTKKEAGTGLGLATVLAIVTEHGGSIAVESKRKRGTAFEIKLPVHTKTLPRVVPSAKPKR